MKSNARALHGLRQLGLAVFLTTAAACADTGTPGVRVEWVEFEAARARWSSSGIADYAYRYTRSCECLPTDLSAPSIEVRGGVIVRVWDDRSGEDAPAERYEWYFTVDDLFDAIDEAIRGDADALQVTYQPILGYPTALAIDYDEHVADEELILTTIGPLVPRD